ncbi:MobF family relaxase [Microlunatus sp. Gsoil 973]|uniref:MobF family relaxase n=1 Tax=Microlunatus sp. Gsoil 973 TaxID=2672569 RepID=UPI0012B4BA59|nr:MobF family relaxase [Microlunatus sp. Gsoil 973]QGN34496.1 relaxase domain-containing protein [Microlunatus sp. Gsoil 973]
MTIHVLHAGDGYLYLMRSVAVHDGTSVPGQSLAAYYTASGQPPGRWAGQLASSLDVHGTVTEEQMQALFGEGLHPNAGPLRAAMIRDGVSANEADRAVRLGRRFPVYGSTGDLRWKISRGYREQERLLGRPLTEDERLEVRQRVAAGDFTRRTGRSPLDPLELSGDESATSRSAVAGYDLVFTPVKSVAVLWGLGSAETRQQIYEAHRAAVADAIGWLEANAAYTRAGSEGQAQIDTTGVLTAVFDHWDSRAGDPDLHTHVAISNKVMGLDGKWRSLDGRSLFAAAVSLSERYNTRIEDELRRRLGVDFEERGGPDDDHRAVREIVGVPSALISHFSKRRQNIERAYRELVAGYRSRHGRDPSEAARLKLYQQATLSDRPDKQAGRSLQQMVGEWTSEAQQLLGITDVAADLERRVRAEAVRRPEVSVGELADTVLRVLSASRSTWNIHHVRAEAHRQSRPISSADRDALVEQIVAAATDPLRSIRIQAPRTMAEPRELQRSDGESVFVEHATERFTTVEILKAEDRIVGAARARGAAKLRVDAVWTAIDRSATAGRDLNKGQQQMVAALCLSGRAVQLGLAPAGSGKTTALRAVTDAWTSAGRDVLALAPSAAAAEVLSTELGVPADTVAKFDHDQPQVPDAAMILIDEAGMAGTLILDRVIERAGAAGAVVRLIGDDQQLGAVEAGGVIRQIAHDVGAVRMQEVVRFTDPAEARATLQVRDGEPTATDFYLSHDRVVAGTTETVPDAAYQAWLADVRAHKDSVLLASSSTEVSALNARARADRVVAGMARTEGANLRDGNVAGVGDWITTRRNERLLTVHAGRDWVKNGDSWVVDRMHEDGALTVVHRRHGGRVTLPPDYVDSQVELGYARSIRRSQGLTVDHAHLVVDPRMRREELYVGLSRARQSTRLYVAVMTDPGPDHQPDVAGSAAEVLRMIINRSGAELSANETIREAVDTLGDLRRMAVEYEHTLDVQVGDRFRFAAERVHPGLTDDPAWPQVVRRLHRAEAEGWTPEAILRTAQDLHEWGDARSDTEVMAYRLDVLLRRADHDYSVALVPQWLAVRPPGRLEPPWDGYLPQRYAEMADRITGLADSAEAASAPWLATIGSGPQRADAIRQVVAYRAVYDVATDDPLGPEPQLRTRQHHAWSDVRQALHRSQPTEEPQGATRLLAELEAEPRSVDDRSVADDRRGPTLHL